MQPHLTTLDVRCIVLDVGPNAFVDPRSFYLGLENTTLLYVLHGYVIRPWQFTHKGPKPKRYITWGKQSIHSLAQVEMQKL